MLASGGLRGEVLLWDLATLRGIMAGSTQVRLECCQLSCAADLQLLPTCSCCMHRLH